MDVNIRLILIWAGIGIIVSILVNIFISYWETMSKIKKASKEGDILDPKDEWILQSGYNFDVDYSYRDVVCDADVRFLADTENRVVMIFNQNNPSQPIPFSHIIDCSVQTDGENTGNAGKALIGGLLAGTTGAVIGSAAAKKRIITKYDIIIHVANIQNPEIRLMLMNYFNKASHLRLQYNKANEFAGKIVATIKAIISTENQIKREESNNLQFQSFDNHYTDQDIMKNTNASTPGISDDRRRRRTQGIKLSELDEDKK